MKRLAGKRIFVTGAGGDIGSGLCARFLMEGARVAASDLKADAAACAVEHAGGGNALALSCDVTDSGSMSNTIARAVAFLGGLDVICAIAGGSSRRDGRVTEASDDEFWRVIRVDLYGTFLACKHGIPELVRAGGGSIITMASMTTEVAVADRACYSAAKGGVIAMTRAMAAGHAAQNVRVNAIAPGITLTGRIESNLADHGPTRALASRHLLGLVETDDIARLAVYLASDESRRVTGQVLAVDSGVTIT